MDYISDPAIRTRTGAPLLTPWSARGMSNAAYARQTAKDAHTALVHSAISQAEQTPTFAASDNTKSAVVSKIQELMKRLQILQKLFSGNPKGMAQALTQIFKELRGLLKQYKDATGQEFSGADAASTQVTTPTGATPTLDDSATATDAAAASDSATPALVTASYAEVDQGLREAVGSDGLRFLDMLRGVLSTIDQKMLTPARIQHAGHTSGKDEDQAFKDMDEQLTKLKKDMSDMQDDIHQAAPTLGTQLSVSA